MASQQVLFSETIMAMKKAMKRKTYESDSDSEVENQGNRGQKLKKRARFAREGQLAPPSGPEVYREIVEHAGHHRAIINRNPPLIDEEGYEIDSSDDEERVQEALDTSAEFNPYANLRLESILAPLTAVTDLPAHPTLSRPYTSETLTNLTKQGCETMHRENQALWKVKHLQTKLVGDHDWVPCEMMLGPNDIELYKDDYLENWRKANESQATANGSEALGPTKTSAGNGAEAEDVLMAGTESAPNNEERSKASATTNGGEQTGPGRSKGTESSSGRSRQTAKEKPKDDTEPSKNAKDRQTNGTNGENDKKAPQEEDAAGSGAGANRGVVKQEADGRPTTASTESEQPPIHPFFLAPRAAHPDRDIGIPEPEAEDVRRLLQVYVHRQEEVCRGAKRLYEGLLRADRMRKTVFQWSKHEAHAGPNRDMSDGEDWYDKEEWGLEEDLKKGADEEEEDTTQPAKKTRARR